MTRKSFMQDIQTLKEHNVKVQKGSDDGIVEYTTNSGVLCSIMYTSLENYPDAYAILTTDDDALANSLCSLEDVRGSISDIISLVEKSKLCHYITQDIPYEHSQFETHDAYFFWCKIPFSGMNVHPKVFAAINIMSDDHILVCASYNKILTQYEFCFFCIDNNYAVCTIDIENAFKKFCKSRLYYRLKKIYFEWTLKDYVSQKFGENMSELCKAIITKLENINKTCIVCHQKFNEDVVLIKPSVCTKDFCNYRFLEYGLGADVNHIILNELYLVDTLIQLTFAAASSGENNVLDPFPFFLQKESCTLKATDIAQLIQLLPSVRTMRNWVKSDELVSKLNTIHILLFPLLRWILSSNTSFLEDITDTEDQIYGIPNTFRQFRISTGTMQKEHSFTLAKRQNAINSVGLYAFHGSHVHNWHSILRIGLHYKKVTNGRVHGDGIYHAKEMETSTSYAGDNTTFWCNSELRIKTCLSLNEIVNNIAKFASSSPYYVVKDIEWVQLRYLFVKIQGAVARKKCKEELENFTESDYIPTAVQLTCNNVHIKIPREIDKIKQTFCEPDYATPFATKTIMRDIMHIRKNREFIKLNDRNIGNLYRLQLLLYNFDPTLPLFQDLCNYGLTGITLEINFSPNYPVSPPFIRVVYPRLLQFCDGGGGHVTAGGSICMDLLTSSGWLPSYNLESVLLQVHLALSSLEPQPARLCKYKWNTHYSRAESCESFVRVAREHGWSVDFGNMLYYK